MCEIKIELYLITLTRKFWNSEGIDSVEIVPSAYSEDPTNFKTIFKVYFLLISLMNFYQLHNIYHFFFFRFINSTS